MRTLLRLAPLALFLTPGLAEAGPIASFAQTQPDALPFMYWNGNGTFSASTAVVFNFLASNDSGSTGPVPALLQLNGTTTGPVSVTPAGLLIEQVDHATFALTGSGGPLDGLNLLSGTLTGFLVGQGSTAAAGGSQIAGHALTFTSAFRYDLGGGLQSLGAPNVFGRDAIFGLAGINPGPLIQLNGNLSGTPAGSDWGSSITGSFSAVPSPCSGLLTGLGLSAVLTANWYRRRR